MYKIEKVPPGVVRPLRHKVLRSNLPFEASCLPSDNDPDAIHFTLKKDDTILSVASLYSESLEAMPNKNAYRLRGMATEPAKQRKGFGATILRGSSRGHGSFEKGNRCGNCVVQCPCNSIWILRKNGFYNLGRSI